MITFEANVICDNPECRAGYRPPTGGPQRTPEKAAREALRAALARGWALLEAQRATYCPNCKPKDP